MKRAIVYLSALALLLLVPGGATGTSPKAELAASTAPTTADGFTDLFAAKNDLTWSGGDQMTSYKASNGQVYWITGDVMTSDGENPDGSYPAGTAMVSNRILLQQGGELVNAMAAGGTAVPDPATRTEQNAERYWPQGAFEAGGFLYVLCQRVVNDPDPAVMFRHVGVEMARFRIGADGLLTLDGMLATPSTGVPGGVGPAAVQWAGDAIVTGGMVYVYGYTLASGNPYVAHYTYVARVPASRVEQPGAWRFYAATTGQWVNRLDQLDADPASQRDAILPTQVASARIIGGQVVLLHKPWNGLGSAVYAELSASPVGPFQRVHLFDAPAGTWNGWQYQTYGPMLHPEQPLTSGKVLVSVDWNWQTFDNTLASADLYKPRFYEVTLP